MRRTYKGYYTIINEEKYIGSHPPYYRSSWELTFMRKCDEHPSILQWASEPFRIPYYNTVKNKHTVYVPDFLVIYIDADKNKIGELVEIKPLKQTVMEKAKSKRDKLQVEINALKWQAAVEYAERNGLKFRVMTEEQLFPNHK